MQPKFKRGDKVRYIGEGHYIEDGIEEGEIVEVIGDGFDDDCIKVKAVIPTYVSIENLELVSETAPPPHF